MRPRLLDLFAGAGGCTVGYQRAGFHVLGVDNLMHPTYPGDLIVDDAMTAWAARTGGLWVIENVPGVPMPDYVTLCGSMFDLRATDEDGTPLALRRHRLFESNAMLMAPGPCRHDGTQVGGVYGGGSHDRRHAKEVRRGGYTPKAAVRRELMGIDWMSSDDLSQAIPPAYTQHLGDQLMAHLGVSA